MLNNIPQRLARIVHRAYRQAKPVTHTLLAMLVTIGIFMSSVSVSPPSQAALVVGAGVHGYPRRSGVHPQADQDR